MNIIIGWLIVGTLDITYAIVVSGIRGVAPIRVLQSVAAGLLGPDSFKGGIPTEVLGLALHYFIALVIVVVYAFAARRIPLLLEHPVLCGGVYGIGVYVFMNFVVIPLSRAGRPRYVIPWVLYSIAAHIFLIGMPAGIFGARHVRRNP